MGNRYLYFLKEFLSFIRIENCLFTSGIALSGYMIFNRADAIIAPLLAAMFLGTGASYAYNYLNDRREDAINRTRLNMFVLREGLGKAVVASLFCLGFLASLSFSSFSLAAYAVLVLISVIYSGWIRLKERFLLKNMNTGFGLSLSFVVGAGVSGRMEAAVFSYAFMVFMLGFAANVLGDIRGSRGDRAIGILTLPIAIGPRRTKMIIYAILLSVSSAVPVLNHVAFYPLLPFMAAAVFLLSRNMMRATRASMLSSFTLLPLFLVLAGALGA